MVCVVRHYSPNDKMVFVKKLLELFPSQNQWLSLIKTQEYQCVQAKALPMRHYLMKYVMPDLTQALLDCSEIRPEDPIDFIVSSLQVIWGFVSVNFPRRNLMLWP